MYTGYGLFGTVRIAGNNVLLAIFRLSNIKKLQAVQNFTYRIVSGTRKYDHVTPLLKELSWLPVASQLYHRSATMAFKCMTGCAPEYLSAKFIKRAEISGRNTRGSQMLNIPLFKTTSGQRTFYYRTVSIWNSLDCSLKLCNSVAVFKHRLGDKLLKELWIFNVILLLLHLYYF